MPDCTYVSKPPKVHAIGIKHKKATCQCGIKADNLQKQVEWRGFGRLIFIIELTLPMRMTHLPAESRPVSVGTQPSFEYPGKFVWSKVEMFEQTPAVESVPVCTRLGSRRFSMSLEIITEEML